MPLTPTTRLGLTQPDGAADLLSTVDDSIRANNTKLDDAALIFQGTFAARGTAASRGALNYYYASDTGQLAISTGTVWVDVSPGPGAAPIGASMDWFSATDPADTRWLIADGRAISRTTYPTLFTLVGTTHGTGDGSTTFNLPDTRGRITVGKGSNTNVNAIGKSDATAEANRSPKHWHDADNLTANLLRGVTATQTPSYAGVNLEVGWAGQVWAGGFVDVIGDVGNTSGTQDSASYITVSKIVRVI